MRFLQFATIIDCWASLDAVVCAELGFQEIVDMRVYIISIGASISVMGVVPAFETWLSWVFLGVVDLQVAIECIIFERHIQNANDEHACCGVGLDCAWL